MSIIIKQAVDAITQKPITHVTIPVRWVKPRTWIERITQRRKPPETERTYTLYPVVAANMLNISANANLMPEITTDDLILRTDKYMPTMIYIIAAAIQNDHREPDKDLQLWLMNNLDVLDIQNILVQSIGSTHMQSFMTSIFLIKSTAAITESPIDGRESIASHTE